MTTRIDVTQLGLEQPIVESVVQIPDIQTKPRSYVVMQFDAEYGRVYPDCEFIDRGRGIDDCGDYNCLGLGSGIFHCGCIGMHSCKMHYGDKDDYRNCHDEVWKPTPVDAPPQEETAETCEDDSIGTCPHCGSGIGDWDETLESGEYLCPGCGRCVDENDLEA